MQLGGAAPSRPLLLSQQHWSSLSLPNRRRQRGPLTQHSLGCNRRPLPTPRQTRHEDASGDGGVSCHLSPPTPYPQLSSPTHGSPWSRPTNRPTSRPSERPTETVTYIGPGNTPLPAPSPSHSPRGPTRRGAAGADCLAGREGGGSLADPVPRRGGGTGGQHAVVGYGFTAWRATTAAAAPTEHTRRSASKHGAPGDDSTAGTRRCQLSSRSRCRRHTTRHDTRVTRTDTAARRLTPMRVPPLSSAHSTGQTGPRRRADAFLSLTPAHAAVP